jgi:hypothetical protein
MAKVSGKHWSDFWQKYVPARVPSKGLSPVHISATYSLEIASGGNLVKLNALRWSGFDSRENVKRGIVKDFSIESRQRLQRLLASINQDVAGLPTFLTLTYPFEYSLQWEVWKRDLDVFFRSFRRKWPRAWGVWRLEFQKRGAPHFHLLLWDGPIIEEPMEVYSPKKKKMVWIGNPGNENNKELFQWFSSTWYRVVGSGDGKHLKAGTRIEPIQSWNGVFYYTSKYLAKMTEGNFVPEGYAGRYWGIINKSLFPIDIRMLEISEGAFLGIKRVLQERLEEKLKRKIELFPNEGITTFMDNEGAISLLESALINSYENIDVPF